MKNEQRVGFDALHDELDLSKIIPYSISQFYMKVPL